MSAAAPASVTANAPTRPAPRKVKVLPTAIKNAAKGWKDLKHLAPTTEHRALSASAAKEPTLPSASASFPDRPRLRKKKNARKPTEICFAATAGALAPARLQRKKHALRFVRKTDTLPAVAPPGQSGLNIKLRILWDATKTKYLLATTSRLIAIRRI